MEMFNGFIIRLQSSYFVFLVETGQIPCLNWRQSTTCTSFSSLTSPLPLRRIYTQSIVAAAARLEAGTISEVSTWRTEMGLPTFTSR
ncbi:hypothetical protein L3Y34_007568 [Caenorhabditis briggsae]|nr:hypothetical protein L3Y34_007568 [Caenorhabditis briggsae]